MQKLDMFAEEVAVALTTSDDEVYCSSMCLMQNSDDMATRFFGPGCLYRDQVTGEICYKIFVTSIENARHHHIIDSEIKAGQLLTKSVYFSLSATDQYGREWTSEQTLPDTRSMHTADLASSGCTIVATGMVRVLKSCKKWTSEHLQLNLLILRHYGTLDIPFNETTSTSSTVAGGGEQGHWRRNACKFTCQGCEFVGQQQDGVFQLEIRSEAELPAYLDVRVTEAFQFILARQIRWQISANYKDGELAICISAMIPLPSATRFKPPIPEQYSRMLGATYFYDLFGKYLDLVCRSKNRDFHPCSKWLSQAVESSSNSLQLQALGLGVVVEGLIKEFFGELKADTQKLDKTIEAILTHDEIWESLPGWNDAKFRKKRMLGALKSLRRTSTADRLYQLARTGAVESRLVDSWKLVRHPAAHGSNLGNNVQEALDSVDAVVILIHQIVFHLIGYVGPFVDFSTHGYPHKDYPILDINA